MEQAATAAAAVSALADAASAAGAAQCSSARLAAAPAARRQVCAAVRAAETSILPGELWQVGCQAVSVFEDGERSVLASQKAVIIG